MNKDEAQKIASALRLSLPYLWDGNGDTYPDNQYIHCCNAVAEGFRAGRFSVDDASLASRYIDSQLRGYSSYSKMLVHEYGLLLPMKQLQTSRRTWMLKMIQRLEEV